MGNEIKSRHEDFNSTLDGASIPSVTTKIQVSFLTTPGFHHKANGDFKTVKSLMAVIGQN